MSTPRDKRVEGKPEHGPRSLVEPALGGPHTIHELLIELGFSPDRHTMTATIAEMRAIELWLDSVSKPSRRLLLQLILRGWMTEDRFEKFYPIDERDAQLPLSGRYYLGATEI